MRHTSVAFSYFIAVNTNCALSIVVFLTFLLIFKIFGLKKNSVCKSISLFQLRCFNLISNFFRFPPKTHSTLSTIWIYEFFFMNFTLSEIFTQQFSRTARKANHLSTQSSSSLNFFTTPVLFFCFSPVLLLHLLRKLHEIILFFIGLNAFHLLGG